MGSIFNNIWHQLPPEISHKIAMCALSTCHFSSFLPATKPIPSLSCNIAGIQLSHPIGLASGFNKNGKHLKTICKLGFSFVEIGTVTPLPQKGNSKPRVFKDIKNQAIINRMGFNSGGFDAVAKNIIKQLPLEIPIGVNIGPNKNSIDVIDDFCLGWKYFKNIADYVVLNISSPNTEGLRNWHNPDLLFKLLKSIFRTSKDAKLFVKFSPDRNKKDDKKLVKICFENDVSGIILSNTTIKRPHFISKKIINEIGGLSGQPLINNTQKDLESFASFCPKGITIISVGGFSNADDISKAMENGASAIQIFTSLIFQGPSLVSNIINNLNYKKTRNSKQINIL